MSISEDRLFQNFQGRVEHHVVNASIAQILLKMPVDDWVAKVFLDSAIFRAAHPHLKTLEKKFQLIPFVLGVKDKEEILIFMESIFRNMNLLEAPGRKAAFSRMVFNAITAGEFFEGNFMRNSFVKTVQKPLFGLTLDCLRYIAENVPEDILMTENIYNPIDFIAHSPLLSLRVKMKYDWSPGATIPVSIFEELTLKILAVQNGLENLSLETLLVIYGGSPH